MWRFLKNSLIFLVIAYGVPALYIQLAPMAFHNQEYPIWLWKQTAIETTRTPTPETIILGDSRTLAGIEPEVLGPHALSLAIGGGSPIEAAYTFSTYLKHNEPPRSVVLAFTPVFLEVDSYFWDRNIKYNYMPISDLMTLFAQAKDLHDWPWGGKDRRTQYVRDLVWLALYRLNVPILYRAELYNARLFGRLAENRERYTWLETHQGHSFFGTESQGTGLIEETRRKTFKPSPLIESYLDELLSVCDEKQITVYWVIMPVSMESSAAIAPTYREGYLKHIRAIAARHPSVVLNDTWPSWSFDNFGDSSHLNKRGAARFSQWLKSTYFSQAQVGSPAGSE